MKRSSGYGGSFNDEAGIVVGMKSKDLHRDITKKMRHLDRSIAGWRAMTESPATLDRLRVLQASREQLQTEANKVQREAIAAYSREE